MSTTSDVRILTNNRTAIMNKFRNTAENICKLLMASDKTAAVKEVAQIVEELCASYPVYAKSEGGAGS